MIKSTISNTTVTSCRREICRNKFMICLTSVLLILIYLLSFGYTDFEYDDYVYAYDHYGPKVPKDLEQVFKNELGVIDVWFRNRSEKCSDDWIITAFPGNDINAHVWEYLSLQAVSHTTSRVKIQPYLAWKSRMELEQVFDKIDLPTFNEIHPKCYNLARAQLAGSTTELNNNIDDSNYLIEKIVLLRRNAKRYFEIFKSGKTFTRNQLEFTEKYVGIAERELSLTKNRLGFLDTVNKSIVGIFIDKTTLPLAFFERAINFYRKQDSSVIFLVICSQDKLEFCYSTFPSSKIDTRVIQQNSDKAANLAILSFCNHTIIASDISIIAALYNQGTTIVYDNQNGHSSMSEYMSENFTNWYAIA